MLSTSYLKALGKHNMLMFMFSYQLGQIDRLILMFRVIAEEKKKL